MIDRILTIWSRIETALIGLLVLCALATFMGGAAVRVLAPQHAVDWAEEVALYFIIWATALAGSTLAAEGRHINTEIALSGLRPPARRAMAMRWTTALVEHPVAMATTAALRKADGVSTRSGVKSSQIISTIRRPQSDAIRLWCESTAGTEDAPGIVRPRASAMAIIVEAVPMVMQVPAERAIPPWMPSQSASLRLPARRSSQYFQASEPEPSTFPAKLPRSIGPAGR